MKRAALPSASPRVRKRRAISSKVHRWNLMHRKGDVLEPFMKTRNDLAEEARDHPGYRLRRDLKLLMCSWDTESHPPEWLALKERQIALLLAIREGTRRARKRWYRKRKQYLGRVATLCIHLHQPLPLVSSAAAGEYQRWLVPVLTVHADRRYHLVHEEADGGVTRVVYRYDNKLRAFDPCAMEHAPDPRAGRIWLKSNLAESYYTTRWILFRLIEGIMKASPRNTPRGQLDWNLWEVIASWVGCSRALLK